MADKSPRKSTSGKQAPAKSLKEKRADKKAKHNSASHDGDAVSKVKNR